MKIVDLETIFYHADEFCKFYDHELQKLGVQSHNLRRRKYRLSWSEVLTIMLNFPHSGYKTFKDYYIREVLGHLSDCFPGRLVSYNRFVELQQMAVLPMFVFAKLMCTPCDGISYIDSTALEVCHQKRIATHKVFKGAAARGKTSTGWFFGFKLHLIFNRFGEVINFDLTPGNVADNNGSVLLRLTQKLAGKFYGDKGYILSEKIFRELFAKGVQVITKIRSNMKNKLLLMEDKMFLKSRGMAESCLGLMKERLSLEHSRHRSSTNFLVHIFTVLGAYAFIEEKPTIRASGRAYALTC